MLGKEQRISLTMIEGRLPFIIHLNESSITSTSALHEKVIGIVEGNSSHFCGQCPNIDCNCTNFMQESIVN